MNGWDGWKAEETRAVPCSLGGKSRGAGDGESLPLMESVQLRPVRSAFERD